MTIADSEFDNLLLKKEADKEADTQELSHKEADSLLHKDADTLLKKEADTQELSLNGTTGNLDQGADTVFVQPDGGWRAWLVLASCCLTNGIIFGIINTFGILYDKLHTKMEAEGVVDASAKCAFVGSLAIGTTFFLSSFVGVLSDKIGLRTTAVIGGVIATFGMGLSAVFNHSVEGLYFTYGILFGTGSSLAYTPSLTILGHYFKKHMGFANGVVTAGSSVFTIALSFMNPYILEHENGLTHCLSMFTVMTSVLILCALCFKPLIPPSVEVERGEEGSSKIWSLVEKVIHLDNWRNKRYVIWALAIPSALFGYFVPYVHIVSFAKAIPLHTDEKTNGLMAAKLMTCIGITSGVGRLVFGKVADMESVKANGNRVVLQQVAFVLIGLCTMLLTVAQLFGDHVFPALMIFCLIMGFFDGCFITLLGPIAFDICGPKGAGQAIGFLLCLCSIPLTVGPPIAGALYDHFHNYQTAFILAGIPPILGATLMLVLKRFPAPKDLSPRPLMEGSSTKETLVHLQDATLA